MKGGGARLISRNLDKSDKIAYSQNHEILTPPGSDAYGGKMFKILLKNYDATIYEITMQTSSKLLKSCPLDYYWDPKRGLKFYIEI